eukprot:SM000019S05123  [mRNA]  locus=s19:1135365:1136547:+ [translate_table: standard]
MKEGRREREAEGGWRGEQEGEGDNADNVYWQHRVSRHEAARIVLHGSAEFEACNVTIEGQQTFEVPTGHRMRVSSSASGGALSPCSLRLLIICRPVLNAMPLGAFVKRSQQLGMEAPQAHIDASNTALSKGLEAARCWRQLNEGRGMAGLGTVAIISSGVYVQPAVGGP